MFSFLTLKWKWLAWLPAKAVRRKRKRQPCSSRRAALELCIPSCPTAGQQETIADNRRGDEIISKSSLSDFVRKHTCFRTPRRGRRSWIVPGRRARYLRQEFSNIGGQCTSAAAAAASSNEIYTSSVISLFNRVSV